MSSSDARIQYTKLALMQAQVKSCHYLECRISESTLLIEKMQLIAVSSMSSKSCKYYRLRQRRYRVVCTYFCFQYFSLCKVQYLNEINILSG